MCRKLRAGRHCFSDAHILSFPLSFPVYSVLEKNELTFEQKFINWEITSSWKQNFNEFLINFTWLKNEIFICLRLTTKPLQSFLTISLFSFMFSWITIKKLNKTQKLKILLKWGTDSLSKQARIERQSYRFDNTTKRRVLQEIFIN